MYWWITPHEMCFKGRSKVCDILLSPDLLVGLHWICDGCCWNALLILDIENHFKNCPAGTNLSFFFPKANWTLLFGIGNEMRFSMIGFFPFLLAVCPFNQLCSILLLSPIFCSFRKLTLNHLHHGLLAPVPALYEFLSLEKKNSFVSFHFLRFPFSLSYIWLSVAFNININ